MWREFKFKIDESAVLSCLVLNMLYTFSSFTAFSNKLIDGLDATLFLPPILNSTEAPLSV